MSEYKNGLLGLGGGMCSTECHSSVHMTCLLSADPSFIQDIQDISTLLIYSVAACYTNPV